MKAKEVLSTLQISRSTLKRYRDKGYIKAIKLPTGQYDFDEDDVNHLKNLKNHNSNQITVLYIRVPACDQKSELTNQIKKLKNFANSKGYKINKVYQDITNEDKTEKNKQFLQILDLIIQEKIRRVIITDESDLSSAEADLFNYLCHEHGTEIVAFNDTNFKTNE